MRVDGEYLDDLEIAGDHSRPEETLGDEVRIVGVPLLPGQVRVLARGDLQRDHVAGGEPQDDPADEAKVGEPVRHVPEVSDVLRQPLLVDDFDVPGYQTELPEDDDGLDVVGPGSSLRPLPLHHEVEPKIYQELVRADLRIFPRHKILINSVEFY